MKKKVHSVLTFRGMIHDIFQLFRKIENLVKKIVNGILSNIELF